MQSESERLMSDILSHSINVHRYATAELKEVMTILGKAHDSIIAKIAATKGPGTQIWLKEVLATVNDEYDAVKKSIQERQRETIPLFAEHEADVAGQQLGSIPVDVKTAGPDMGMLMSSIRSLPADAGSTLSELLDKFDTNARARLTASIRQGMTEGETLDQLVRRIRGSAVKPARWGKGQDGKKVYKPGTYEGGVIDTTTRGAEAYVRTTISHIANTTRNETYKANEDLVKAVQWVATLDLRTCIDCAALDGKTWALNDPHPTPPIHPGDRCVLTPVLKSWKELGIDMAEIPESTRASMDGQVPESLKYGEWLKRQPAAKQDEVLGKGRADLFRAGKTLGAMTIDNRAMTLKELKSKK